MLQLGRVKVETRQQSSPSEDTTEGRGAAKIKESKEMPRNALPQLSEKKEKKKRNKETKDHSNVPTHYSVL